MRRSVKRGLAGSSCGNIRIRFFSSLLDNNRVEGEGMGNQEAIRGVTSEYNISAHDLRHQVALLACDLSLVMERMKADKAAVMDPYAAILERLDDGLTRTLGLLEGHGEMPVADKDGQEQLIREIWDRFVRAGQLRSAASELVITTDLPLYFGQPRVLHSLVLNLLTNAVAAAPEGPIRLEVLRDRLILTNGGTPLPSPLLEMLSKGGAPEPQGERGHGLGLILRAAAELDLALAVESVPGGTRFGFKPRDDGKPRILLIEDDAELRHMMTEFLRYGGYHVEARERGDDLVPGAGSFAAVLTDLNLPGLDGDLLLARWKRRDPAALCVLLTGEAGLHTATRPGVDHIVVKPGLTTLLELLAPLQEPVI
ncbi:MAG: hybrid sensor histidine kinase/response regulator [bacterium]|nr:hybrid sensor histidine kinase/response regulator [bacterium]